MITDEMINDQSCKFSKGDVTREISFYIGAKWMQEQSMRWVKSKERLPPTRGFYHVKNFAGNPSTEYFNSKEIDWSAIEWLFEPPKIDTDGK